MTLLLLALLGTAQPAPPLVRTPSPPPILTAPVPAPPPQTGPGGARARANLASLISSDDYPQDAKQKGEEGTTSFRLEVGPDGRVTSCVIERSSGSASLDSATCRLMRSRARFTPAVDGKGVPTSDTVSARIAWRLPQRWVFPDLLVTSFTIGADGKPRDCSRELLSGGRTDTRSDPGCGPTPPSGPVFEAIRKEAGAKEVRVRMERRLIRDAAAPWPVLEAPGRRIIARELVRIQVAPDGMVIGCSVLEHQSLGVASLRACAGVGGRITPPYPTGEAEMRVVTFTALEPVAR